MTDAISLAYADPGAVELMSGRLLRLASTCAEQADLLTSATAPTWSGAAADDFRAVALRAPSGVRLAADVWQIAAALLREFARQLGQLQADARHAARLLQEADELTTTWHADVDVSGRQDPGAELRARGQALLAEASTEYDATSVRVATVLTALLPPPASRPVPVPSRVGSIGIGLVEGSLTLASAFERTNPAMALLPLLHPQRALEQKRSELGAMKHAFTDPVGLAKTLVDWDMWRNDPWRAAGRALPSLLLGAGTGGTSLASRAATTTSRFKGAMASLGGPGIDAFVPRALRTGGHGLRDINGAPGGPHFDNCPSCAIAVDQTFAGAPASAIPERGLTVKELAARYDGMFVMANHDWIIEQLEAAPNGARGIVFGMRDGREGHVFNAIQEDGRVYFVDGQTGAPAVFQDSFVSLFFLRTDGRSLIGAIAREPS